MKCGRIVHYYPNGVDQIAAKNNTVMLPAIVIQSWDGSTSLNLQVMTMNPDAPNVLRYSVQHIDTAPKHPETKEPQGAYWMNSED